VVEYQGEQTFNHMIITHQTPYYRPFAMSGPNYFDKPDENWVKFKKETDIDTSLVDMSAGYFAVRARKNDVYNSIRKRMFLRKILLDLPLRKLWNLLSNISGT